MPLHPVAGMTDLVADRFVPSGRHWIDIATGERVSLRVEQAGTTDDQFAWSLHCETLANLRHDLVNPLIDFGMLDRERRFEAYRRCGPVRAGGRAAERMFEQGLRFLRAHDVALPPPAAALALRPLVAGPAVRGRPLGVRLQPRAGYDAVLEALDAAAPVGVARVTVAGPVHSGLRTLRQMVARAARLHGYVPVDAALVIGVPWLCDRLEDRHVCVLALERGGPPVAALLARLAAASARRHLVVSLVRRADGPVVHLERMGVGAMTAMIHVDRECGPSPDEIFTAARDADGRPGLLLARLAGISAPAPPAAMLVRETAPAYGTGTLDRPEPARGRVSDVLLGAAGRADRLSRRGRHVAAARLLSRAMRVTAARGARGAAADLASRLGILWLERGLPAPAVRAFEYARELAQSDRVRIGAAIGIGEARLLDARVADAEAAFRGALAAAREGADATLRGSAAARLAGALCRQSRYDEAEVVLDDEAADRSAGGAFVRTLVHLARGRVAAAMGAAQRSLTEAQQCGETPALARGYEAMARARAASGDAEATEQALSTALRAVREAHHPLDAVRLRIVRLELLGRSTGSLPRSRRLPPLLRADLAAALARRQSPPVAAPPSDLEAMLLIAQGAESDSQVVEKVCEAVLQQTGARSVLVLGASAECRQLGLAGKPWHGDTSAALRVLSGESRVCADPSVEPCQAAEPVRYAGEVVAAIACRFTAGSPVHVERTSALLRAAALAIAPGVRGVLDRAASRPPDARAGDLLGESVATRALRDAVARAARAPFPVLVEGESGSGKELVARAIHRLGPRRERRFCAVNCAALSDDLLEAELFGHARGAFTGAVGERAGLFEDADGGTVFLDEVGELSPRAQAKLLRVLQDGEVRRVGENVARRVDVRIVAATNRRLEAEVSAGRFRADLRFRLDVVRLDVPPLRERSDDVPLLASRFWTEAAARVGSQATLAPETLAALARYGWPGNVRELQNVMAWIAVHAPGRGRVAPSALPAHVAGATIPAATTFEAAREEFERRFIRAALASANGQRGRAAQALGVSRQGLGKMLRRLHIEAP
jgi:DNA-binding NtrC family response regulator/tetratricopeptide (TPR) repeat protein